MKNLFLFLLLLFVAATGYTQNVPINSRWINGFWDARWIVHPTAPAQEYGVYHFRKTFDLASVPASFIIHVSADNRYRLLINGKEVSLGPARGDLRHWRFESVDIAPHLRAGKNVLAAVVWNFGKHSPAAQTTQQTAFILQGNGETEKIVNTDRSWKVVQNQAYSPELESFWELRTYIVVGPGDIVDGKKYPWGWEMPDFDDNSWGTAGQLSTGQGFGRGTDGNWLLMPRDIPMMESFPIRLQQVRRSSGVEVPENLLKGTASLTIPPNTTVSMLLDQTYLVTAYPEFTVSGGEGAEVKVSYSEALFDANRQKGNRNEIEGKELKGYSDRFMPDGGENRLFRPLWFRTWRYMQLDIKTGTQPLVLKDIQAFFTGYPFEEKAQFTTDQPWLSDVWKTGWRTARLCAGETYYDCPYYEQLQYVGDTRIQALISLYVTGDDRLMRRAINDFEESRLWNGLTQSRYPCQKLQLIPTYSLFWVSMIHDYWMHRPDTAYVHSLLPGTRAVLGWYETQMNTQNLLKKTLWWNFVDWTNEWENDPDAGIGGIPAQDPEGNSSILSLQYAYTLRQAEELHRAFGENYYAEKYKKQKEQILRAVYQQCWNSEKGLFSDVPGKPIYSQHANMLAILADAVPQAQQPQLMQRILSDSSLIQATFYFKFYLFRALDKTRMADQYLPQIEPWRDMIKLGLTTFAEKPDPTRSDCHAWSASPNYDMLATVAGITPASPGFRTVRIAPTLGELKQLSATMPHPSGTISLTLDNQGKKLKAEVELPAGLSGIFEWKGKEYALSPGKNSVKF